MFFLRKVKMDKWPDEGYSFSGIDEIPAEPITKDMPATRNTLSIWKFNQDDIIEGALTIALGCSGAKIDTLDIIYIDETDLAESGLELNNDNPGDTFYLKYRNNHYDICNMNHKSLGKVAKIIIDSINKGSYETVLKDDLLDCLVDKITIGEIKVKDLPKSVYAQIQNMISV